MLSVQFIRQDLKLRSEVALFFIDDSLKLSNLLENFNKNNAINKAIKSSKSFGGKEGETLMIFAQGCTGLDLIILIGIGKKDKLTSQSCKKLGGKIVDLAQREKIENLDIYLHLNEENEESCHLEIVMGILLKHYNFNKYYVAKKSDHSSYLQNVKVIVSDPDQATIRFAYYQAIVEGVNFTRDLVNEPANIIYPQSFMEKCLELSSLGVSVKVLDQKEMAKLGMGAILAVAQGSENDPYLVVMEWLGGAKNEKPIALVGKGVTFDTGGNNLKPSAYMTDMKYDMAGAAVVAGAIKSFALNKVETNVIGVIGLVENMISGKAQRPGDVIVSMSGQTIEVDNTDAEGRLVLADAMWYVQENYQINYMVDFATLTGAIVVALGNGHGGLFSNDDKLAKRLIKAGQNSSELLWRLPMNDHYDKMIDSDIADIRNTGRSEKSGGAGSITAAQFLQRFVKNGNKWAHIDIAGVAWSSKGNNVSNKGATGFGIMLLNDLINNQS